MLQNGNAGGKNFTDLSLIRQKYAPLPSIVVVANWKFKDYLELHPWHESCCSHTQRKVYYAWDKATPPSLSAQSSLPGLVLQSSAATPQVGFVEISDRSGSIHSVSTLKFR